MTQRLTGRKSPNTPTQGKTHLACSNVDKAEVLADTLEMSFKPNQTSKLTVEVEQEITKHYLEHPPETEAATIEECSSDVLRSLIKKLKNGKALGKDGITIQAIKMLPNAAVDRLAEIFKACLQHQRFPKAWKEVRVIVFPKAGKPLRDPTNYRPISLLSGLLKLFEKGPNRSQLEWNYRSTGFTVGGRILWFFFYLYLEVEAPFLFKRPLS
ncbi:hypothetical protein NDU88_007924 [Pleurodeles waltl]|uniref:Reverse transcriptase n=1 Tax=Pleurodeles waltl TaxID=8319 RepID=A0AAV7NXN0_PLEWA|nr:hypothetical protein NDU88_007924 [Pleurodeles waltl]